MQLPELVSKYLFYLNYLFLLAGSEIECKSLCACEKCAENLQSCHMCRQDVKEKKKVFLD